MDHRPTVTHFREATDRLRLSPGTAEVELAAFAAAHAGDPLTAPLTALLEATADFLCGRYVGAEAGAESARAALDAAGEPALAGDAHLVLGNVSLERGDYRDAASHYTEAADRHEGAGDDDRIGRVYNNLGLVAWRTGDLRRAEEHFVRALDAFGAGAAASVRANLLSNLGLVYEDRGDTEAAEAAWRSAATIARGAGDRNVLANALANLGDLHEARADWEGALALHAEALAFREAIEHRRGVVGSNVALARVALAQNDTAASERHVFCALDVAREMQLRKHEADALGVLARLREAEGRLVEALDATREEARARHEVLSAHVAARVSAMQEQFDARQARALARRAEAENVRLLAAMRQVEAASAARAQFLATMSHEMRTPLTSILGAAELFELQPLSAPNRRLVRVIATAANALLASIGDVLDLSRIDSGTLEIRHEPFAPRALVQEVADIVDGARRARGLDLALEVSPKLPNTLLGDRARVRQVLVNLVSNAVKFTPTGGVTVSVGYDDGRLLLSVRDTGPGVTADLLPRLFEPFFQAESGANRTHGGSGLGLTLVERIVRAMSGRIDARSTPGQGAIFDVALPMAAVEEPPPPAKDGRPLVLLVEDDERVREVLVDLLAAAGAEVRAAGSGAEALGFAKDSAYDLALVDLHMPVMDGMAVARALHASATPPRTVVAMSGALDASDAATLTAAGFSSGIAKPVTLRTLRELIRAVRA